MGQTGSLRRAAMRWLVAVLASSASLFGQDQQMIKADSALVEALAKADKSALQSLLDTDFIWIDADGRQRTKTQVLEELPAMSIGGRAAAQTNEYTYGDLGDVQENSGRAHVVRVWVRRSGAWKARVYQEVLSLEAPPTFTPGAGTACENPCRAIPFAPQNETELGVAFAYTRLETAAHARNSTAFGPLVGEEFAAASSNSDHVQTKRGRMAEFDRSKDGGLAPTPLVMARMFRFGDAVLMVSEHQPDRGKPLRVTRIWVKRNGNWMEVLSYQTAVAREP